ncbi:hypothetical protein XELAEV_18014821mg, partial [Xenopus laevis]
IGKIPVLSTIEVGQHWSIVWSIRCRPREPEPERRGNTRTWAEEAQGEKINRSRNSARQVEKGKSVGSLERGLAALVFLFKLRDWEDYTKAFETGELVSQVRINWGVLSMGDITMEEHGVQIWLRWAAQRAAVQRAGMQLGFPEDQLAIKWFGFGELLWHRVMDKVLGLSTVEIHPDILVFHAGGNDMGVMAQRFGEGYETGCE